MHMTNDYHFITHWHVTGRIEDVYDLIANPVGYPRWWTSVYLEAEELARGDENGLGRRFRLHTKGFLPYTLRWESCAIEAKRPYRLEIRATGDLHGRGIWALRQNGPLVHVNFDWKLTAEKPLIRYLSFSAEASVFSQPPMGDGPRPTSDDSRASEAPVLKSATSESEPPIRTHGRNSRTMGNPELTGSTSSFLFADKPCGTFAPPAFYFGCQPSAWILRDLPHRGAQSRAARPRITPPTITE
jgi:hypothetical protein